MKYALLITLLGITLILGSCTNDTSSPTATPTETLTETPTEAPTSPVNTEVDIIDPIPSETTDVSIESEVSEQEIPEPEVPELVSPAIISDVPGIILEDKYYSIKSNETRVQLRNDLKTVLPILGTPVTETTAEQLGDGADTFSEMYSKTITYEGLTLNFLGMSEDDLWLADLKVSGDEYQTSEGIKVGDNLKSLLDAYPNISYVPTIVIEDKPNARVYSFWQDSLGFFAEFTIDENDRIEDIRMYFLFD